jgi:DNA adenine methylase
MVEIADRLRMAQIENVDGVKLMERLDSPETFMFVDPPYPTSTLRNRGTIYSTDYDDSLHGRLLEFVAKAKSKIMLASYPCELYDSLLVKGWVRLDKAKVVTAVRISPDQPNSRRPRRTESLYLNFTPPQSMRLL